MAERFDIEKYLKDLSPEQQEKAKACKTKEELLQLAAQEEIEIPMQALDSVAGGCLTVSGMVCCSCGSEDIGIAHQVLFCKSCGSTQIKNGS